MMVLISYDVSTTDPAGKKRLRDIAKKCNLFILANFILSNLANMEKAPSKKGG